MQDVGKKSDIGKKFSYDLKQSLGMYRRYVLQHKKSWGASGTKDFQNDIVRKKFDEPGKLKKTDMIKIMTSYASVSWLHKQQ